MRRTFWLIVAAAFLAAACGESAPSGSAADDGDAEWNAPVPADAEAYPLVVSSELVVGSNRFLVGLLNDEDAPIGSRAIELHARFFNIEVSGSEPVSETDLEYIQTIPGERGLYVGEATFDEPGTWGAEVDIEGDGIDETVRTKTFEVVQNSVTPALGAKVPASDTPTLADTKDLATITTDAHPDRRFYRTSIAQAVRAREPFVVVFATPKFCTSAVCGPTLDIVKDVARGFRDLTFIHVEVYTNLDDPSNLKVVPSVEEWGLPTEPWVFVVDERGRVAAKFEGTVARGELRDALNEL